MKINNQNLIVNQQAKTAELNNYQGGARQFLKDVAADLINAKDGSVKSGYLKLNAGANGVTVAAGHMGSGASAATDLVVKLVDEAYGDKASEALKTYLSNTSAKNGSVGKIGTQSFVALVRTLESNALENSDKNSTDSTLLRAQVGNHRLQTQHLQPLQAPRQVPTRDSVSQSVQEFLLDSFQQDAAPVPLTSENKDAEPNHRLDSNHELSQPMEVDKQEDKPFIQAPKIVRAVTYQKQMNDFIQNEIKPIKANLINLLEEQIKIEGMVSILLERNVSELSELKTWMSEQVAPKLDAHENEEQSISEPAIQQDSELLRLAERWVKLDNENKNLQGEAQNLLQSKLVDLTNEAREQMNANEASHEAISATVQNLVQRVSRESLRLNSIRSPGLPGITQQDPTESHNNLPVSVTRYPRWVRTTDQSGVINVRDANGKLYEDQPMLARRVKNELHSPADPRLIVGVLSDYGLPASANYKKHVYHLRDRFTGAFTAMLVQHSAAGIPASTATDATLESSELNTYSKLDDAFAGADWKPNVRGYAENEKGIHWILEDLAPTTREGAILNYPLRDNRSARLAVMHDMAHAMTDLHAQGWALGKDMHEEKIEAFGVSIDGKLKLLELPTSEATTQMQEKDVQQLAFQFLTSACDNKFTNLLGQPINQHTAWASENNKEALDTFVNFALQTPEQWAASNLEESHLNDGEFDGNKPATLFMENANVRQTAYKALGLGVYADWLERAMFGASEGVAPASAAELTQLLNRYEKPIEASSRQDMRAGAVKFLYHTFAGIVQ